MTSPYTYFLAERERRLQLLINAGIEENEAGQIAHDTALDAAERKIGRVVRGNLMEDATWAH